MKNLLLILLAVVALEVSAADLPSIKVVEEKTFLLNVNDWKGEELNISLLNMKGEEVYSEIIQPSKVYYKKYNLQVLRKGSYQVIVSSGINSISYNIEVTENSISRISEGKLVTKKTGISRDIVSKIKTIH